MCGLLMIVCKLVMEAGAWSPGQTQGQRSMGTVTQSAKQECCMHANLLEGLIPLGRIPDPLGLLLGPFCKHRLQVCGAAGPDALPHRLGGLRGRGRVVRGGEGW